MAVYFEYYADLGTGKKPPGLVLRLDKGGDRNHLEASNGEMRLPSFMYSGENSIYITRFYSHRLIFKGVLSESQRYFQLVSFFLSSRDMACRQQTSSLSTLQKYGQELKPVLSSPFGFAVHDYNSAATGEFSNLFSAFGELAFAWL